MIDVASAQDRCAKLIEQARRSGADSADAYARASSSESVSVRLGKLEDVERSESEEIALRVFVGQRSATISTSDFSASALAELADRAVDMARAAPEDRFAGLAPEALLATDDGPALDLVDAGEPDPVSLREAAMEAEDAARSVAGVTNSEGGAAQFQRALMALVTSHGFSGGYAATSHGLSASVIAGEGSGMERDYAYRTARHREDLLTPAEIGRLAGERAVARLGPGRLPSGKMPVVFDPRVGGTLVAYLVGAMSGVSIARRASFLLDRQDEELFPKWLRIIDDPHRRRGLSSRPFDGEGLPTQRRTLVENGRLTGWLTNAASARQLGIDLTGNASRSGAVPGVSASNLHMEGGSASPGELIADIADGVLVTQMFGQGVNGVTGDYSRGASGFRIVDGEIAGAVSEITVAGNLLTMFAQMQAANDLELHRAINVPTLRVDGMTVAGE